MPKPTLTEEMFDEEPCSDSDDDEAGFAEIREALKQRSKSLHEFNLSMIRRNKLSQKITDARDEARRTGRVSVAPSPDTGVHKVDDDLVKLSVSTAVARSSSGR